MGLRRDAWRWNGWGFQERSFGLSEARTQHLVRELAARLGVQFVAQAKPAQIADVELPPSRLRKEALASLGLLLEPSRVHTSTYERAYHAAGKSLPDLL